MTLSMSLIMGFLRQTGHRRAFAWVSSLSEWYGCLPRLMRLTSDGRSSFGYVVAHQFEVTWRHPTTCPPVSKIYQIIGDASSVDAYTTYKCVHTSSLLHRVFYNLVRSTGKPSKMLATFNRRILQRGTKSVDGTGESFLLSVR